MKPSDYAVDNASDTSNRYDTHPCGPTVPLSHSYVNGECEDCGYVCEHQEEEIVHDEWVCPDCEKVIGVVEATDFGPDPYDVYKDEVIERGGAWPPWR